jgi:hypothetical protein
MDDSRIDNAIRIMRGFAERTGLTGSAPSRRYLWTDAHAVCNYLSLATATEEQSHVRLATRLVEQVHAVLGRHRDDDERCGWISGLDDAAGRQHPTTGGLRIGKPLPERRADEPYDANAEWDRDGQYYHYLTKWMHALLAVGRATSESCYPRWAAELAITAHQRFRPRSGLSGLYWKMSIDLKRPLVTATGQHDALDGFITALSIRAADPEDMTETLEGLITDLFALSQAAHWETDDPLGIGGLLFDASRLAQLLASLEPVRAERLAALLQDLLVAADRGLHAFLRSSVLRRPAVERLAFRELGLSIGLHAVGLMYEYGLSAPVLVRLDRLQARLGLAQDIEAFWLAPAQQRTQTWIAHEDINTVMLATSLVPAGMLRIR